MLFKAEVGAASTQVCQVQGVWVQPRLRGQGLGTAGTAAVVEQARVSVSPIVSLYVNDFNTAARRAYERVGMQRGRRVRQRAVLIPHAGTCSYVLRVTVLRT